MGYTQRTARILASVSSHNSARDATDQALWNELMMEVKRLLESKRFAGLPELVAELPTYAVPRDGHRSDDETIPSGRGIDD